MDSPDFGKSGLFKINIKTTKINYIYKIYGK